MNRLSSSLKASGPFIDSTSVDLWYTYKYLMDITISPRNHTTSSGVPSIFLADPVSPVLPVPSSVFVARSAFACFRSVWHSRIALIIQPPIATNASKIVATIHQQSLRSSQNSPKQSSESDILIKLGSCELRRNRSSKPERVFRVIEKRERPEIYVNSYTALAVDRPWHIFSPFWIYSETPSWNSVFRKVSVHIFRNTSLIGVENMRARVHAADPHGAI